MEHVFSDLHTKRMDSNAAWTQVDVWIKTQNFTECDDVEGNSIAYSSSGSTEITVAEDDSIECNNMEDTRADTSRQLDVRTTKGQCTTEDVTTTDKNAKDSSSDTLEKLDVISTSGPMPSEGRQEIVEAVENADIIEENLMIEDVTESVNSPGHVEDTLSETQKVIEDTRADTSRQLDVRTTEGQCATEDVTTTDKNAKDSSSDTLEKLDVISTSGPMPSKGRQEIVEAVENADIIEENLMMCGGEYIASGFDYVSDSESGTSEVIPLLQIADVEAKRKTKSPYSCRQTDFKCVICDACFGSKSGLGIHLKSHQRIRSKKYVRPKRMCLYCDRRFFNLPRHMKSLHGDLQDVNEATNSQNPRKRFALLRNQGIAKHNKLQATNGENDFEFIKQPDDKMDVVHCNNCNGSYPKKFFYRHKKQCIADFEQPAKAMKLSVMVNDESNEKFCDILNSFHDNAVGTLCRRSQPLQYIGKHLLLKNLGKVDKYAEVRKSVMSDMRILARLFLEFEELQDEVNEVDLMDAFKRQNFEKLAEAVRNITKKDDDNIKYGLKNNIYYLLLNAATILKGKALTETGNAAKLMIEELDHFQVLLKHHENSLFGDAKYCINQSRQEKLRLPSRIPSDEAVLQLRNYTVDAITRLTDCDMSSFGKAEFVELRTCVCSRLTLFNARRGGEPARMKMSHWLEREKWLDSSKASESDQEFFSKTEIVYAAGKGNHLVDTLVPPDCVKAMDILVNAEARAKASVSSTNEYVFANTENSEYHCSGWDATNMLSRKADIHCPELTATGQRIRMSTIYASSDVPPENRQLFYSHMGHSAKVNQGTYQRPLAIQTKEAIGQFLHSVDAGCRGETSNAESEKNGSKPRLRKRKNVVTKQTCDETGSPEDDSSVSDYQPSNFTESEDEEVTRIQKKTRLESSPQKKNTGRACWTVPETELICQAFAGYVNLPSPKKSLPGKKMILDFMEQNHVKKTFQQVKTKVMNMQRLKQQRARKLLNFK